MWTGTETVVTAVKSAKINSRILMCNDKQYPEDGATCPAKSTGWTIKT